MKNKSGRRNFLKNISVSGTAAAFFPTSFLSTSAAKETKTEEIINSLRENSSKENTQSSHKYNSAYTGEYLNRIAFPIGGLGAGMFCMEGTGAISHMSVRNRPEIFNEPGMFAAITIKGLKNGAKLLEGPVPDWKKFGQREAGNGLGGGHYRTSAFSQCEL